MATRKGTGKRPYRMQARAQATEATRLKILDAAEAASDDLPIDEITLATVASHAGVTVQTVLRHFGSRDGLLTATLLHVGAKMGRDREAVPARKPMQAVAGLIDHYEKFGGRILRLLGAEEHNPAIGTVVDLGRAYHREWCERVFAATLLGMRGSARERRLAQLVAITDIYFWKLLRRDRELSVAQTKRAIKELLEPLMEPAR